MTASAQAADVALTRRIADWAATRPAIGLTQSLDPGWRDLRAFR